MLNSKIENNVKIERFDMAVNFYAVINIDGNPNLICYDFNPAWNSWYPFYDDVNKTPIIQSKNLWWINKGVWGEHKNSNWWKD